MITIGDYIRIGSALRVEDNPYFRGYMDLSEILEMWSGDAGGWRRCSSCGSQGLRWRVRDEWKCFEWCARPSLSTERCRTVGDILNGKRTDPGYNRLRMLIQTQGFTSLVMIDKCFDDEDNTYKPKVRNGHHRIAVAAELGITQIPYTDDWSYYPGVEVAH